MKTLHDILIYILASVLAFMSFYISYGFYNAEELLDIVETLEILCSTLLLLYVLKGMIGGDGDINGDLNKKSKAIILAWSNAYVLFTILVEVAVLICNNVGKSFERYFPYLFILNILLCLTYFIHQILSKKKNKIIWVFKSKNAKLQKKLSKKQNNHQKKCFI
jgi:hypothetical protein